MMSSEDVVAQQSTLAFAHGVPGGQLWRNNNGACETKDGRQIRYGLANVSAQMNKVIKSSDYVGITPTLITPAMVGYHLGVFTALETKRTGWHLTPGDERGQAQARFHDLVRQACGYAGFVTCPADIWPIIGRPQDPGSMQR